MHNYMVTIFIFVIDSCYYYSIVPKNVTIVSWNPQGMSINWLCQIYIPHSDNTNLSVQWYMAAIGDIAEGELFSELSSKYSFTVSQQSPVFDDSQSALNGLFLDDFALTLHNFNSSTDDGYYWCQIVANGSCPLEPSSTGYVALDQFPVETECAYSLLDFIEHDMPPTCAELGTLYIRDTTTTRLHSQRVNSYTKPIQAPRSVTILWCYWRATFHYYSFPTDHYCLHCVQCPKS